MKTRLAIALVMAFTIIGVIAVLKRSLSSEVSDWMEWSLYCFCAGIIALMIGEAIGWSPLSLTGLLLWTPSFLIAAGALASKLHETVSDIARNFRR